MAHPDKKQENAGGLSGTRGADRRNHNRCRVEVDASLVLVHQGLRMPCAIEDLSLGGCRLRMESRFLAGTLVRVEIIFQVCGVAQRLSGVTQWTDGDRLIGIRFVDMTERRLAALADLIADVEAQAAAESGKRRKDAQSEIAPRGTVAIPTPAPQISEIGRTVISALPAPTPVALEPRSIAPSDSVPTVQPVLNRAAAPSDIVQTGTTLQAANSGTRERRAHPRLNVDSSAILLLIDIAAQLHGRIIDLSLGGCLIHTNENFPLGIFRRVETEFRLHGLPFRLAGVTQTIYDPHRVGIRFLNMSDRKREQLRELIAEVMEYTDETDTASEDKVTPGTLLS